MVWAVSDSLLLTKLHVCVHISVHVSRTIWPHVKHWLISQLSSLEATGGVLLKAHATGLATGKNTSLLGMLDQIEMEM